MVVALLLASGTTSLAAEPASADGREWPGLGSEAWIAGWVAVFLALSVLYSFERRHRAKVDLAAAGAARWSRAAEAEPAAARETGSGTAPAPEAQRRPIELLLKKKPAATAERPRPPVIPTPKLNLPETLLRRPTGRGVTESDEESFSVAGGVEPGPAAPAPTAAPPPAAEASAPAPHHPAQAPAPTPYPSRLERCAALRAEGRFEEAARVAREGLAADDGDAAPLLIELSRAALGLGHVEAAIDTARDAHFVARSRESIANLIRVLVETRRFTRADGAPLRRAAARHPEQPLLRHAAGVFESMYGEPGAAERELRAALGLEADPERRAAIERDLAQLQGRLAG